MLKLVTIVVPTFNAALDVSECLRSLFGSDAQECSIIVIDDGSSGELRSVIQPFVGRKNVRFIENFRNRGYTMNLDIALENVNTDYVAICNSDLLFPRFWLGGLVEALERNSFLGAVGPISNAASFQSVPVLYDQYGRFAQNEGFCAEEGPREIWSQLLSRLLRTVVLNVPILNGFCTLFRTDAIRKAGGFDFESFPQGYGEENDLSVRIRALGYQLGVIPEVFVYHKKSRSFGAERKEVLSKEGAAKLAKLYTAEHVRELDETLRNDKRLNALREMTAFLTPYVQGMSCEESVDQALLDGGFYFRAERQGFEVVNSYDGADIALDVDAQGALVVAVPKDCALFHSAACPYGYFFIWLALMSHTRPVFSTEKTLSEGALGWLGNDSKSSELIPSRVFLLDP